MFKDYIMPKLICISFAFPHHKNTNAGYHHLVDYLHYDKVIICQKEIEESLKSIKSNYRNIFKICFYRFKFNVYVTIKCIFYNLLYKDCIFHFIYGENTYKMLKTFLRKTNKVVCTFHQPYSWFENEVWQKRLKQLDGIILMSGDEIMKFQQAAPNAMVKFIPHGVNTDFYYNDNIQSRKKQVLMVGNWLRDFQFANRVFSKLIEIDRSINVVIVTNKSNFIYFTDNSSVKLLSGISDTELRDLYRRSSCLFLPLTVYTANNAILEALAVDCPIIIATNKPSTSYFNKSMVSIIPMNESAAVNNIINTFSNRVYSREFVVNNYSWPVVAKKTEIFFNNL